MFNGLNFALYRAKYNMGKYLPLTKPVDISLELTSQCNMACHYCYHSASNLPFAKGFMKTEQAIDILDQAADMGVHSIKTNHRGEPTLHPDFSLITSYARMLASGSTFIDRITNSNFKFPTKRDDIFEGLCNQTKVKASFDSFIPEVFQKQRAQGNWKLSFNNINKLYNWPGRDNILVIQAVRTKLNLNEDIEGQIRKHWPSAEISIRSVVEGRNDQNIDEYAYKKRDISNRVPCNQAFVRLIVHHDGKVAPCCPSWKGDLIIGDLKNRSLRSIFNSMEAKQLRKDLKSKKAFERDPCKTCSSYESYKGFEKVWGS